MAKVTGVATQLSGKVGQLIYRQTKYGTVVYEAPSKASVPQRTEAQMQIRTQWGNMAAIYRQFNQTLKKGFEGLNGKMNDYNAFIQANTNVVKVYVPKSVRLNGGSVLAPYQITRGSLPSIAMHVTSAGSAQGAGILVSDLNVGSLVIGAETSVADFANALIAYNDGYEAGDQVTFFYGMQSQDAVTGIPRARIYGFKVMLNPGDSTPLWEVVSALGFSSVGGSLGMDRAIVDGAAVWVHSREDGTGGVKCSTQFLYVDSSLLAGYQTAEAMEGAADSYGGINASAVYLNPRSSGRVGAVTAVPVVPSGGSGNGAGTGGGSQSGSGSGSEQGSGGNSGGSSNSGGGSEQTVTVAAPTITGDTTFADTGTVNISAENGAEIHYTLDGSAPTSASAMYSGSITLTDTTTVKAVAVKDGVTSEVASMTFTKSSGNGDGTDFD